RRDAARGDCAGARQPATAAARRRTDRRARSGHRRTDCLVDRSSARGRDGGRRRDPRPGRGWPGEEAVAHAGWTDPGARHAMMLILAVRSLLSRPVRSAVLAGGFGLGVAVMAALLGIGGVILDQARAPALVGGGDVVIG